MKKQKLPRKKIDIKDEICAFLQLWSIHQQIDFIKDIGPLFELYDVDEDNDWVWQEVGGDIDNVMHIRLIRTVYLMSKIAAHHAGSFCMANVHFKDLWRRMEKHAIGQEE